ncbi:MAG: protein kinase [Phycisphaera sp.]|nr:protein kinase [Phycisphaera sp.]
MTTATPGVRSFVCKGCGQKAYVRVPDDPSQQWSTGKSRAELQQAVAPPPPAEEEDDGTIPLAAPSDAPTYVTGGDGGGGGDAAGEVDGDMPWFLAAGKLSNKPQVSQPPSQPVKPQVSEAPPQPVKPQVSQAPTAPPQPVAPPPAAAPKKPAFNPQMSQAPTGAGMGAAGPPSAVAPTFPSGQGSGAPLGDEPELTGSLNGYEIINQLGRGGMGAVYLARQVSLDRPVAIKVLRQRYAQDPVFLARFTREAYAAAQLTHHNIVQIYDIGEDKGVQYFSMEYVKGKTLLDVLKETGRLDVEQAAGYILQAARGLRFAHDHGMIHRDVKPENLILNDEGVLKVADLGLVKTLQPEGPPMPSVISGVTPAGPSKFKPVNVGGGGTKLSQVSNVTHAEATMGTPAYMAPEQAIDATRVDERADVYSLGCVFYALTTGRPVFEGATAAEVITKHRSEMIVPPEAVVDRVPNSVSSVIQKMLAKSPEDRFRNMREVIRSLEHFLGIASGPFTPKDEHQQQLQEAVAKFNTAAMVRVRKLVAYALPALVLIVVAALFHESPRGAAGVVMFGLALAAMRFIVRGVFDKTYLFCRCRQYVFAFGFNEWVVSVFFSLLMVALVYAWGLLGAGIGATIAAAVVALGLYFGVDRLAAKQRAPHLHAVSEMLKGMRLQGLEEDALRRFVCKYAGRYWEEFYETMFGYEEMVEARRRWGEDEQGKPRPKFGASRDRLVEWIDQRERERHEEKEFELFEKLEGNRLRAQGVDESEIREKAEKLASKAVGGAAFMRDEIMNTRAETIVGDAGKGTHVKTIYGDEDEDGIRRPKVGKRDKRGPLQQLLLGSGLRMLVGLTLLGCAGLWMFQRTIVTEEQAHAAIERNLPPGYVEIPMVSDTVLKAVSSHGAYFAGLLLVVSAFFPGRWLTLEMLPGIALMLLAFWAPLPEVPYVSTEAFGAIVGGVVAFGMFWYGKYRIT